MENINKRYVNSRVYQYDNEYYPSVNIDDYYESPRKCKKKYNEKIIQGPVGARGKRGHIGPPGPRGEQGKCGPPGSSGKCGPRGYKGPRGERGPPGAPGLIGEQGKCGPPGPQGERGGEGKTGIRGPMGERGPQGPRGFRGDMGPRGLCGAPGKDCPCNSKEIKCKMLEIIAHLKCEIQRARTKEIQLEKAIMILVKQINKNTIKLGDINIIKIPGFESEDEDTEDEDTEDDCALNNC